MRTKTGDFFRDMIMRDLWQFGVPEKETTYRQRKHGGKRRLDIVLHAMRLKDKKPIAKVYECKYQNCKGSVEEKASLVLDDLESMLSEMDCYFDDAALVLGGEGMRSTFVEYLKNKANRVEIIEYEKEWDGYLKKLKKEIFIDDHNNYWRAR